MKKGYSVEVVAAVGGWYEYAFVATLEEAKSAVHNALQNKCKNVRIIDCETGRESAAMTFTQMVRESAVPVKVGRELVRLTLTKTEIESIMIGLCIVQDSPDLKESAQTALVKLQESLLMVE